MPIDLYYTEDRLIREEQKQKQKAQTLFLWVMPFGQMQIMPIGNWEGRLLSHLRHQLVVMREMHGLYKLLGLLLQELTGPKLFRPEALRVYSLFGCMFVLTNYVWWVPCNVIL